MKGSLFIPIQPIGEHAEQNTIQATANLFYSASFEVDKEYEQLLITFQGEKENIRWFTCNVYFNNDVRGQALYTRKKPLGTIYIGRADAFNSATSIPGTISPGTWELEFEMIPNTEEFQLEVIYELREKGVVAGDFMENQASVYLLNPPVHREKRWYKGDFHTHTVYSDGKMTRARNIEMAKQQKLDFLSQPTITSLPITGHKMKTLFHFPA